MLTINFKGIAKRNFGLIRFKSTYATDVKLRWYRYYRMYNRIQ